MGKMLTSISIKKMQISNIIKNNHSIISYTSSKWGKIFYDLIIPSNKGAKGTIIPAGESVYFHNDSGDNLTM